MTNESLQELINKASKAISAESVSKVARECITVQMDRKKTVCLGEKYYLLVEELREAFICVFFNEILNMEHKVHQNTLEEYSYPVFSRFFRGMEYTKKPPQKAIYIHDPLKNLKSFARKTENNQKIAYEIEMIIKNENIISNLTRFNYDSLVINTADGNKEIPISMMGDGFKVLVSILGAIKLLPAGSVLLLEEPEVHLHPGYVKELVQYLIDLSQSLNVQIFISTHSYDLIDNLLRDENLSSENRKFLNTELQILRLSKSDDTVISEEIPYSEGKESFNDLLLDLRGH